MRKWAAKKDGDLGYLDRKHYPNIANAAFDLKIGELGGPVKESKKHSVIKVLGKKPSQAKPLEDLRDNIRVVIERERQTDAVKTWLEEMRQQKGVEIFTDVLESTVVTPKKEAEAA
jgi:parvulin-like peptidyl-prolyl isomerase